MPSSIKKSLLNSENGVIEKVLKNADFLWAYILRISISLQGADNCIYVKSSFTKTQ